MNASDEYESTEMRMTTVPAVMVGGLMVRIMVWLWLWLRRSMYVYGDRWSSDVCGGVVMVMVDSVWKAAQFKLPRCSYMAGDCI